MAADQPDGAQPGRTGLRAIPKGIWALGLVSLFMDTSSELIHSLMPVFLVTTLGASALSVGWVFTAIALVGLTVVRRRHPAEGIRG